MGLQGEKSCADVLTGALIGLARTTYSHLQDRKTQTGGGNMRPVCPGKSGCR